jgi:putative hydrolase of the HAD superfamily
MADGKEVPLGELMSNSLNTSIKKFRPVIIFDGDDTLWETMPLYDKAKHEYFSAMHALGFQMKRVEREFEKRDVVNVDRLGFSKKRFETSMIETYKAFCAHANRAPTKGFENRIRRIARSVFETTPKRARDAKQVLEKLKKEYRLILLTKGEVSIQRERVRTSGLESFFDEVVLVPHKDAKTFASLLKRYRVPASSTWSVGNSLKSDINPAVKAGLRTIWIPKRTWAYEEERHVRRKDVETISSLTEIPRLLKRSKDVK